jgi:N-acetylglucosamine kinase-like BadF-type ATPase
MDLHIVGEVGSTGADWAVLTEPSFTFLQTTGFNPVTQHGSQLEHMLAELKQKSGIVDEQLQISYYGAGVTDAMAIQKISDGFPKYFNVKSMYCASDLLGAAHALCQDIPGLVCILGTGSNACFFDGSDLVFRSGSLGYPLGDEGSGWDIGKHLAKSFYYGELPKEIHLEFAHLVPKKRHDFLNELVNQSAPNQYLASFAKFAYVHQQNPFVDNLIRSRFQSFIKHHVSRYEKVTPVHFVGSIAHYFKNILESLLVDEGYTLGNVLQKPISALATYHHAKLK